MFFKDLVDNLTLLVTLSVVSGFIIQRWGRSSRLGQVYQGLLFGVVVLLAMNDPMLLAPGLFFDGRSIVIGLAGYFFGPLTALIPTFAALTLRISIGGSGLVMGVSVILASAVLGIFFYYSKRRLGWLKPIPRLVLFGLLVHVVMVCLMFTLPREMALNTMRQVGLPILTLYPLVTVIIGKVLIDQERSVTFLQEMQQSEAHHRLALEGGQLGAYDWNVETGENTIDERWAEMIGYRLAEIQPYFSAWENLLHPDDADQVHARVNDYLAGKTERYESEHRLRHKDGHWVWILARGKAIERAKDGRVLRLSGTHLDISERKRIEQAEHAHSEQIRRLYEASQRLNRTLDPHEIYQTVYDFLSELIPLHGLMISSFNPATQQITCEAILTPLGWVNVSEFPAFPLEPEGLGFQSVAIRTGQSLMFNDFQALVQNNTNIKYYVDFATSETVDREVTLDGASLVRSVLIVPLKVGGQVTGVVQIFNNQLNAYQEEDLKLIEALALHIASAHQNAILYAQARAELAERRKAEARLEDQLQRLSALQTIDTAIIGNLDLPLVVDVILKQVTDKLHVSGASLWLVDAGGQTLSYAGGHEMCACQESGVVALGQKRAGQIAAQRAPLWLPDLHQVEGGCGLPELAEGGLRGYYGAPLISKDKLLGVLEVCQVEPLQVDAEWFTFFNTLANQAAIAIDDIDMFNGLRRSNQELSQAYEATIEGWSRALDLRDHETEGHSQRVTQLSVELARHFDLSEEAVQHIRRGALLHDIGKVGVPDEILLKPDKLSPEEWAVMKRHPAYAYALLHPIVFLRPALDIPYCHHEKWDGTGYPRALTGEAIPLAARIFAVVDVWDALTSDRPYRRAWSQEDALRQIANESGKHFDPQVVAAFLSLNKQ